MSRHTASAVRTGIRSVQLSGRSTVEVTRQAHSDWGAAILNGVLSYLDVLHRLSDAREFHEIRSGISDEDYVRPGISIEIPLFWGTF